MEYFEIDFWISLLKLKEIKSFVRLLYLMLITLLMDLHYFNYK